MSEVGILQPSGFLALTLGLVEVPIISYACSLFEGCEHAGSGEDS